MKKKALALLVSATMVASLAACGSTPAETTAPAAETTAAETTAPAAETTAATEATDVTLTVWSPAEDQSADNGNWLGTMCDQFNAAHPEWNITFNYGVCPEGEAKATVTQDVAAAADVYMYANDNLPDLVSANAIAEIGGSALEYVTSTNSDSMVKSVTIDGAVYGFPFTANTWFMYYDKSVFTEDDVKSLDKMLEVAAAAGKKVAFPLTNSWYIASFYAANGCTLFGDGTDEAAGIDFSGDKAAAVTSYLVDLNKNAGFVVDADGLGVSQIGGDVAAMFSGTWDFANVNEKLGENFAAAQLPTANIGGAEGQLKAFASSKAIGVNAQSQNMAVAVALAQYLASEEAQLAHYTTRNIIPSNVNLLADATIAADPVAIAQGNCVNNTSILQPLCTAMGNYWGPAENMGKAIVSGDVTADNAAEQTEAMNGQMNTTGIN